MGFVNEHLTDAVKTIRVLNAVAAGVTPQTSSVVNLGADPVGYACRFTALFGAITAGAVTSIKVQQSADGSTGWEDIPGATVAVPDTASNKAAIVDVKRPQKPYLQLVITRGTQNAVIDAVIAEVYGNSYRPVVQDATVAAQATVHKSA